MLGKVRNKLNVCKVPYFPTTTINRNGEMFGEQLPVPVDNDVLVLLAFQACNIPPVYWVSLIVLSEFDTITPENSLLGFCTEHESLEYPNYYIIPYYSNYVISRDGVLIKKSNGTIITPSLATTGYYTFRMVDDSGHAANVLRHRVLAYAFKPYPADVNSLDINHLNGIPGSDDLGNLEWATRSRNMSHAYDNGLRNDNVRVQIRNIRTNDVFEFRSYAEAGEYVDTTGTTVANRIKKHPTAVHHGYQYRIHNGNAPWPDVDDSVIVGVRYVIESPSGQLIYCSAIEAAELLGVTRTSFLRIVREGRLVGNTDFKIHKAQSPTRG